MNDLFSSPVFAALVALVPASVSLWRGRSLVRLIDDPALPERLLAGHRASGFLLAFSLVVLIFNWPHYLVWTLPLLFVARLVAVYPLRKMLYRSTGRPRMDSC